MSISETELANQVVANLELGGSANDISRFKIYENLSIAQLNLLNILPLQYLSESMKTVLFSLEKDMADYQWPAVTAPFLRYVAMWVDFANAIVMTGGTLNPGNRVTEYDHDIFQKPINEIATVDYPFIDLHAEQGYMIYPTPTANVTNGGRLRYVFKPDDITSGQDSILNPKFKNLLIYRATALCAVVDNFRPDLANLFEEFYDKELAGFLPKEEIKK